MEQFMKEHFEYIRETVGKPEILAVVAEEAAELSHAALKLRRVINEKNLNPTPVNQAQAIVNLIDEYADVVCAMFASGYLMDYKDSYVADMVRMKMSRWVTRLSQMAPAKKKAGDD